MTSKTPYQLAVEKYGEEEVDKLSRGAVDPETGYVARHLNAAVEPEVKNMRCNRCGGYGMWSSKRLMVALCLRCFDEWEGVGTKLLRKHGYVWSKKKWLAAFNEFCKTKPKEINITEHNREVESRDHFIHTMLPQYFKT